MKNQKKILGIGLLTILLIILFLNKCSCNKSQQIKRENAISKTDKKNAVPFPNLDIPYQNFLINPEKPIIITTKLGTTINIPKDAFLDANGKIVKDEVSLNFREFHNPLDFYLAGIPMNYNDNGEEKTLESGGMVEINTSVNGSAVFVNPKNKINVSLYSWSKSKDFNLYDLDINSGKWIEKGKDSISVSALVDQTEKLLAIPPVPKLATINAFRIADDTKLYPEIEDYKDILFEPINPSKCAISNAQEMIVKELPNGIVEVTSIIKYGSFRKENKCKCYIAFEKGVSYNKALEQYQKKYKVLLSKREYLKKEWDDYYSILEIRNKFQIIKLSGEEKIIRTLAINNFGFVNIDYPTSFPSGGEINPIYVNENGNAITLSNVVLVEKNTNALFRYYTSVKYNPKNRNVLW